MIPVVAVGAVGAAIVAVGIKVGATLWLTGIATDPLTEDSRKDLLDSLDHTLAVLETLKLSPPPEKVASLREDAALLRPLLKTGWRQPWEFWAATRIMNFCFWERAKGATRGTAELISNSFQAGLDKIFNTSTPQGNPEGNVRS